MTTTPPTDPDKGGDTGGHNGGHSGGLTDGDGAGAKRAVSTRSLRRDLTRHARRLVARETIVKDLVAGLVLGIESVPDGLASGLLAGLNPIAGLYAYLFGMVGAVFATSTTLMAVQSTGAMALVVSDTDLSSRDDPARALATLTILTGVAMLVAGLLRGGRLLRFVPTAVMTGFMTAVGVNIVLGQLANFTGYDAPGRNRVLRTIVLVLHPMRISLPTLVVGVLTLIGIVALQRTRLRSLGLVIAVALGSVLAYVLNHGFGLQIAQLSDIAVLPRGLPLPIVPSLADAPGLILLPALSLAFVAMIQGAGVSTRLVNPDGHRSDSSRDFIGQGVGNLTAGVFRGMPVGGSMSASSLVVAAGARTKTSLVLASVVMALVMLLVPGLIGFVSMPALAALLIVIGATAVKPAQLRSVIKTGAFQTAALVLTFALTLVFPLQYAVLAGVAFAILMYVAEQSNRITVRQLVIAEEGEMREVDPPTVVPAHQVTVLQPYGSLFFASAPTFESRLPEVDSSSEGSVVIIRLRGVDQLGLSMIDVLGRYADALHAAGSSLILIVASNELRDQLIEQGLVEQIGEQNVYVGDEWLGHAVRRANTDAWASIRRRGRRSGDEK